MTYDELVTAIENTTENSYAKEDVDRFIRQAEQAIYNAVQLPASRKSVTGTMTAGNKYLATPSDYLAAFSLAVQDAGGVYSYLLNKDVNFIREAYPNPADTGLPAHYGQFDENTFILGPTPDAAYAVELHYYAYPASIVDAGTTWLGAEFDSALLNLSLVEAARFMKAEQDIVALYQNMSSQSLALLKNLADGKLRQDTYRSGQVRNPVI